MLENEYVNWDCCTLLPAEHIPNNQRGRITAQMRQIIDFHTHILPCVDDGSHSLEETAAMLRLEAEQGISHVVATPHFYPQHDKPDRFLARRAAAAAQLKELLAEDPALPQVTLGAEVHYFRGIGSTDVLPEFTIGGGKYILVEMPSPPWSDTMYQELEKIHTKKDLIPIIAHIDRYIRPFRTFHIPERLSELPVLIQANADFFLERATARMALKMLRSEQLHLLGSDCHNMSSRKPNLAGALAVIEKRLGEEALAPVFTCQRKIFL